MALVVARSASRPCTFFHPRSRIRFPIYTRKYMIVRQGLVCSPALALRAIGRANVRPTDSWQRRPSGLNRNEEEGRLQQRRSAARRWRGVDGAVNFVILRVAPKPAVTGGSGEFVSSIVQIQQVAAGLAADWIEKSAPWSTLSIGRPVEGFEPQRARGHANHSSQYGS